MNNPVDNWYISLLGEILEKGERRMDRTGTGTLSVFGKQFRHDMSLGFPLLTTKRVAVKSMVAELRWFLRGQTNIRPLVEAGCNIWNGDAYKRYVSSGGALTMESFVEQIKTDDNFAAVWGDLGPIYGKQWRNWGDIDQLAALLDKLKNFPTDRRLLVSAWNVGEMEQMVLPPCHYSFQLYAYGDGRLSLMWNQRSCDVFLGLPFNIASYGLLLSVLAKEADMVPGELIGNLGDTHLYSDHVEQAKEQMSREPRGLPSLILSNVDALNGDFGYEFLGYEPHPAISAPLSN